MKKVENEVFGDEATIFTKIPSFLRHLKEADPTAHCEYETQNGAFYRLFIAPTATREAVRFCRPFIALDGTFWKTRWNLTLLLAVTMDGDNQILPLAWGIVPSESTES